MESIAHGRDVAVETASRVRIANLCFPDEVWRVHIFPRLGPLVRLRCAQVNSTWRAALREILLPELLVTHTKEKHPIYICEDSAQSMYFSCTVDMDHRIPFSLSDVNISWSCLVRLNLTQSRIDSDHFARILGEMTSLHELNIGLTYFYKGETDPAPLVFPPNLARLSIGKTPWPITKASFSQLWKLTWLCVCAGASVWEKGALASLAHSLTTFITASFEPSDGRYEDLSSMVNLTFLRLDVPIGLTDTMLAPLCKLVALRLRLQHVGISPCEDLTGEFFKHLTKLTTFVIDDRRLQSVNPFNYKNLALAEKLTSLYILCDSSITPEHIRPIAAKLTMFKTTPQTIHHQALRQVFADMDPSLRTRRQVVIHESAGSGRTEVVYKPHWCTVTRT